MKIFTKHEFLPRRTKKLVRLHIKIEKEVEIKSKSKRRKNIPKSVKYNNNRSFLESVRYKTSTMLSTTTELSVFL